MFAYLVRRLATIIPTLFFVSVLIFGLQQLLPGDPAVDARRRGPRPERHRVPARKVAPRRAAADPLLYWVGGVLHGDLGESVRIQKPVLDLILEKLPVTIELAVMAIADRAGDRHHRRHRVRRAQGRAGLRRQHLRAWGLSTPNFWLGIMLILLFSVTLGWLPASGYVSPFEDCARTSPR